MPITRDTLTLNAELRTALQSITDEQTRDLVRAWASAWDEVAPALRDTLEDLAKGNPTRATILRSERLRRSLATIADHLDKLAHEAGVRVTSDVRRVVDQAGEAQASILRSQLPQHGQALVRRDAWARVDPRQVSAIVARTTEQITKLSYPLSDEAYASVKSQLVRGMATGANPREVARRMVARAEGGFNGGLNRALTISRTELLDAHRAAAALGQAEHADVLRGWVWGASMSGRTCAACLSMSGTEFALSDPGPQGHQNCRCTRIPLVKSWGDLGVSGNREEPPSLMPDAGDYFNRLPKAEQVRILGVKGHAAWSRGDWPMEHWATLQNNPGWRDSWVVARPGTVGSRAKLSGATAGQPPGAVPKLTTWTWTRKPPVAT